MAVYSDWQGTLDKAKSSEERYEIVCCALKDKISKILAINCHEIWETESIPKLMADSPLIAVEVRNWYVVLCSSVSQEASGIISRALCETHFSLK